MSAYEYQKPSYTESSVVIFAQIYWHGLNFVQWYWADCGLFLTHQSNLLRQTAACAQQSLASIWTEYCFQIHVHTSVIYNRKYCTIWCLNQNFYTFLVCPVCALWSTLLIDLCLLTLNNNFSKITKCRFYFASRIFIFLSAVSPLELKAKRLLFVPYSIILQILFFPYTMQLWMLI